MSGKLYFVLVFLMITIFQASAYLDPGTGSMIVSAIIGVFATAIYCLRGVFYKIIRSFRKDTKENNEEK